MKLELGIWSEPALEALLGEAGRRGDIGERIGFLSGQFLGVDYEESTLIGDPSRPEVLVIHLQGMDCFTYLDYVESLRRSRSFPEFVQNLRRVRYRDGIVAYPMRNHFFSDWRAFNPDVFEDPTERIGREKTVRVRKLLNRGADGQLIVPAIEPTERSIAYIPSDGVDGQVLAELRTGDYIGVYSMSDGLDVSHVGIYIEQGRGRFLRHASSQERCRKVVDEDFPDYVKRIPGILVLRPRGTP